MKQKTEYRSSEFGYMPHQNQTKMVCPVCGHDTFGGIPQSISIEAPIWCFEYKCQACGHIIGIEARKC